MPLAVQIPSAVSTLEFIRCTGVYKSRDPNQFPKLMLLDLKMPLLDGFDVLRELKSDDRTRAIPIVAMTSSNQDRDVAESYRLGVNGYITKPVQVAAFMEIVLKIGRYWLSANRVP
jgi:CheY-like chemotaxis protein